MHAWNSFRHIAPTTSLNPTSLLSDIPPKNTTCLHPATSGVLCVALHHEAAARGCEAFRERRARKTYLAVVEGTVDAEGVPRREEEPKGWGEGKDGAGGRKRRPDSVQHTPAHGFFQRKKVGGWMGRWGGAGLFFCGFSTLSFASERRAFTVVVLPMARNKRDCPTQLCANSPNDVDAFK